MPTSQLESNGIACPHLFAYGSLVDPRCLDEVLGHRHTGERLAARLRGFERVSSPTFPYPYLVAAADQVVQGVLIMDLTPYDLHLLDRYEDLEAGTYARRLVEVESWGCGPQTVHLQAYTYIGGPQLIASTAS
jgi:gamma-glutamylcyclotransferase (GGCT)/AIG2-like uncharacterized protein YtfP